MAIIIRWNSRFNLRNALLGKWARLKKPVSENATYRECPTCDAAVHSGNNFREVDAIHPGAAQRGRRGKD